MSYLVSWFVLPKRKWDIELSISSIYKNIAVCLGRSCTKLSNCYWNEINTPESTTECQIKTFIPIENMNVENLRATKSNRNMFSQVSFEWLQKSTSLRCLLSPTLMFSFFIIFFVMIFLIITKDGLIDSWSIYNLIGKFLTH